MTAYARAVTQANIAFLEDDAHYQRHVLPGIIRHEEERRAHIAEIERDEERGGEMHYRPGGRGLFECGLHWDDTGSTGKPHRRHDRWTDDFGEFLSTRPSDKQICPNCLRLSASPYRWHIGRYRGTRSPCATYTDGCALTEDDARRQAVTTARSRDDDVILIMRTTAAGGLVAVGGWEDLDDAIKSLLKSGAKKAPRPGPGGDGRPEGNTMTTKLILPDRIVSCPDIAPPRESMIGGYNCDPITVETYEELPADVDLAVTIRSEGRGTVTLLEGCRVIARQGIAWTLAVFQIWQRGADGRWKTMMPKPGTAEATP